MNRKPIGNTGLSVTELGFGSAPIGNLYTAVDESTAHAAVDAAWQAGIRYFDTAPHYGLGLAERRLGTALRGKPRDEFVISTKVGRLLVPNAAPTGHDPDGFAVPDDMARVRDYSRDGVLRSIEASLTRLGLDRIDIALAHDPDEYLDQTVAESIPALVELRDQGVIRAVGVGMNYWQPLHRIVTESPIDTVMIAGRWTLLDRSALPLLDACAERGVAGLAAAPYNSGLLALPWPSDDASFDYDVASVDVVARARKYASICQAHGTTLPVAALQFPLRHPAVATVVTGMRTADEAAANAQRFAERVPEAVWHDLDVR